MIDVKRMEGIMLSIDRAEGTCRCQGCSGEIKKGTLRLKVTRESKPPKKRGTIGKYRNYETIQRVRKVLNPPIVPQESYCVDCLNNFGEDWQEFVAEYRASRNRRWDSRALENLFRQLSRNDKRILQKGCPSRV